MPHSRLSLRGLEGPVSPVAMPKYTQEQAVALLQKVDSDDGASVFDHLAQVVLKVRRLQRAGTTARLACTHK